MSNKLTTFEQFKMLGNKVKGFVDNQISNLAGLTSTAISELKTGKQDKLTGKEGQVVGFNSDGNIVNFNGPINQNLIDNPNFKVNQRNQSSYTGEGYTVDRWKLSKGTLTIDEIGIILSNGGMIQPFESIRARDLTDYTFSIMIENSTAQTNVWASGLNDNFITIPPSDTPILISKTVQYMRGSDGISNFYIACIDGSVKIIGVKFEFGDRQTLAHKDSSGNWVLNEIPNYALELAKCQRYFERVRFFGSVIGDANVGLFMHVPYMVQKRAQCDVSVVSQNGASGKISYYYGGNYIDFEPNALSGIYDHYGIASVTLPIANPTLAFTLDASCDL